MPTSENINCFLFIKARARYNTSFFSEISYINGTSAKSVSNIIYLPEYFTSKILWFTQRARFALKSNIACPELRRFIQYMNRGITYTQADRYLPTCSTSPIPKTQKQTT